MLGPDLGGAWSYPMILSCGSNGKPLKDLNRLALSALFLNVDFRFFVTSTN